MNKINVFIVEDHQMVREMWVQLFSGKKEIEVIGATGNAEEAVEKIKNKRPEIVLLDINLPGSSGMDLVPQIRKFSPGSKIIAVSMHNQPAYTKKMLQLGAMGYVTKNSSHEEIYKAIDSALAGKTYVCSEIRYILSEQALTDEAGPDVKELSIREIEIIRLIKEGLSSKEIAAKLNISTRTAEVHRHNILKKLGLRNTASLISFINTTDI